MKMTYVKPQITGQSMTATETTNAVSQVPPAATAVVNLDVVPDCGGATYDAFVIPSADDSLVNRKL